MGVEQSEPIIQKVARYVRGGYYRGGYHGAYRPSWRGGYYGRWGGWARPHGYWWRPGGAIAAGAAIGFVTAATAAAWAARPRA